MSCSEARRAEVYKLLACQREGEGDDTSLDRLKSILRADPEARQYFIQQSLLSAHLGWMIARPHSFASPVIDSATSAIAPTGQDEHGPASGGVRTGGTQTPTVLSFLNVLEILPMWMTPKIIVLTVASLLGSYFAVLALSVIVGRARSVVSPEDRAAPQSTGSFATMSRAVEPRWQGDAPQRGDRRLPTKEYVLEAGLIEFTLDDGACVVIEGPARFQPVGANALALARGRLVAQVPPRAVGFRVTTPTAEVVDRGTEFDVAVDRQGSTDVHVLKGRVEVKPTAKGTAAGPARQAVLAGQAVRVSVDDPKPVPIEFSGAHFATVRSALPAAPPKQAPGEDFAKGAPIWLGNLFDDAPTARLADAVRTDPFKSVPKAHFSLGVERVFHFGQFFGSDDGMNHWDGGSKLQITPRVTLDLSNLGWKGCRSGAISNDAYTQYPPLPDGVVRPNPGSISTRGTLPVAPDASKVEEGIGMQADALLTFDLDEIRAAGDLAGCKLLFHSNRAGINDGSPAPRELASVYMLVVVSDRDGEVVAAQLNGKTVRMVQNDGAWSVASDPGKPLSGLDEPVSFVVRIPADARYLTLITTVAGDSNTMDHAVWSGACLKAVP